MGVAPATRLDLARCATKRAQRLRALLIRRTLRNGRKTSNLTCCPPSCGASRETSRELVALGVCITCPPTLLHKRACRRHEAPQRGCEFAVAKSENRAVQFAALSRAAGRISACEWIASHTRFLQRKTSAIRLINRANTPLQHAQWTRGEPTVPPDAAQLTNLKIYFLQTPPRT